MTPSVVGVDEVGRGCLAGPVLAAAVILPSDVNLPRFGDSKKIPVHRRLELAKWLRENAWWAIGQASVQEIDQFNILQASLLAMQRAVLGLEISRGEVWVDGKFPIPGLPASFNQNCLIHGDALHQSIGAASILAKVTRDQILADLDKEFPGYELGIHKGYGTASHRAQIKNLGPSPCHRRSFSGVKEYAQR